MTAARVHAQTRAAQPPWSPQDVMWHVGDPADERFLEALIVDIRPDEIYNLAAISRPVQSWLWSRA